MIEITAKKFAKMYVENNPGEKFNEVKSNLKAALSKKKPELFVPIVVNRYGQQEVLLLDLMVVLLVLQGTAIIPSIMKFIIKLSEKGTI